MEKKKPWFITTNNNKEIKVKSNILNEHFQCGICEGYIIDATTITDCMHSFCKSCIIHFIENINNTCPTCNNILPDVKNCIKSDSSLQRLIYKLVPSLLDNEIDRREKFYKNESKYENYLLNNESILNVKLSFKNQITNDLNQEAKENDKSKEHNNYFKDKYIQCFARTPINILTKLLRNKYNIPFNYKIKLSHNGSKLNENETLLQTFTCFLLNKNDLFQIEYEFIKIKLKQIENININKIIQTTFIKNTTETTQGNSSLNNKQVNNEFLKVRLKRVKLSSQSLSLSSVLSSQQPIKKKENEKFIKTSSKAKKLRFSKRNSTKSKTNLIDINQTKTTNKLKLNNSNFLKNLDTSVKSSKISKHEESEIKNQNSSVDNQLGDSGVVADHELEKNINDNIEKNSNIQIRINPEQISNQTQSEASKQIEAFNNDIEDLELSNNKNYDEEEKQVDHKEEFILEQGKVKCLDKENRESNKEYKDQENMPLNKKIKDNEDHIISEKTQSISTDLPLDLTINK